jgi:hypothetical protein
MRVEYQVNIAADGGPYVNVKKDKTRKEKAARRVLNRAGS